jgi:ATP-dependent DNA helicase PIF1
VLDVPYDTYRETCVALGFLDDDNEWDLVMTESAAYDMPSHVRATFVMLLVFKEVGHPAGLFDKHWTAMGEDFVHRLSSEDHPLSDAHLMILVLVDINMRLEARNTNLKALNLPMPEEEEIREVEEIDRRARIQRLPTVRRLQICGDLEHSRSCIDKSINGDNNDNFKFNNGKRSVFDTLMEAKDDEARQSRAFLISAAGGTGKTYLLNTLLDAVRSNWGREGEQDYDEPSIGLATTSTGIAATLLKLGQTCHSTVKAP